MKTYLPRRAVNIVCGVLILLGLILIDLGATRGPALLQWVGLVVLISFLPFRFFFLRRYSVDNNSRIVRPVNLDPQIFPHCGEGFRV